MFSDGINNQVNKHPKSRQHDKLSFKNGNPGSVLHGNFINYYQFHPPDKRISLLPDDVWDTVCKESSSCILDVGCNAGDLTIAVYEFLTQKIGIGNINMVGIDIDPILIDRANEKPNLPENIKFKCVNIMDSKQWTDACEDFFKNSEKDKFSVVFCFSITMWIHLNHGDEGLKHFLKTVSEISSMLVIEPQPWKCYRTAKKRLKLSNEEFPEFKNIKIRENVEKEIERFLLNEGGCQKLKETTRTDWGRKLLFFKC